MAALAPSSHSISIGGGFSYNSYATLSDGTAFDGGDERLIGLSYASGRILASATTYYGSTAATPKVIFIYLERDWERERGRGKENGSKREGEKEKDKKTERERENEIKRER